MSILISFILLILRAEVEPEVIFLKSSIISGL